MEWQVGEGVWRAGVTTRQPGPSCHYRVEGDFQVCPSCGTKLRRPCPRCEHLLELKWNVCPYCGYGGGAMDGRRRAPSRQSARAPRRPGYPERMLPAPSFLVRTERE